MMTSESFHIHQLMLGRLTKINKPEDDRQLDELMAGDPAVREKWEELVKDFEKSDIEEGFSRYNSLNWLPSDVITAPAEERSKIRSIFGKMPAVAAIVAAVSIGAYFLFLAIQKNDREQPSTVQASVAKNEKVISLQLAGGGRINLSQAKDSTLSGLATINNTGSQLSYKLQTDTDVNSLNTLHVPVGRDYEVVLSDGTHIWLNSQTDLKFPFSFADGKREIALNGEAYLQVAKDKKRPFIVHTSQGTVQVLGTSFNINSYDSSTVKVALVEGSVRFTNNREELTIKPGTEVVSASGKSLKARSFNSDMVLGWREGLYYFNDASMPEILSALPRWFGIEVKIDNSEMKSELFTGVMDRNKPVNVFLDNLKSTMHFDYSFDKEGVLHIK